MDNKEIQRLARVEEGRTYKKCGCVIESVPFHYVHLCPDHQETAQSAWDKGLSTNLV